MREPKEDLISKTRVRLHFPTDRSVHIGDLRLALMTSLWTWSKGGALIATNDNSSALEDLAWLEVEPDETVSKDGQTPADAVVDDLVERQPGRVVVQLLNQVGEGLHGVARPAS